MKRWNCLLRAPRVLETQYRSLIAEFPAFFLLELSGRPYFAISELRLGANHIVDLVIASDQASNGIIYTLIELERPQDEPFKKKGDKSARLSHAIDQIQNWQRWISDNRDEARRLFPCGVNTPRPIVEYKIIIGSRLNTDQWTEKRNDIAGKMGCSLRSYDSLADHVRMAGRFFHDLTALFSSEERHLLRRRESDR